MRSELEETRGQKSMLRLLNKHSSIMTRLHSVVLGIVSDFPVLTKSGINPAAVRTVVSCGEIIKHRNYAVVTKIETSMIEGEGKNAAISKIRILMKRKPGVKELLQKIAEENAKETDYERHLRQQDEKLRDEENELS
eukprot:TRINITY_DN7151_c0_g1_i2.p1 TRINITY_DN7151_c0_g1~~TRINITY_DN7151_c0_g1_i2.p1  ORF type:complete len:137 (-),score=17.33 TRINITY_DN7151_c0_g1_i2:31-441(-)